MEKIHITPDMLTQLSGGQRMAGRWFDGKPETAWFPGWDPKFYPASIEIDLKKTYEIALIRVYDGSGKPTLGFQYSVDNKSYKPLINIQLEAYQQWREIQISVKARYLKVTLSNAEGDSPVGEIELYHGAPAAAAHTSERPVAPIKIKNRSGEALKMGVNGFHWVPPELLAPFGLYREYQCWEWMEQTPGLCRFEPTDSANGQYDTHYAALKTAGVKPVACVNQTPGWLLQGRPESPNRKDFKPVPVGESAAEPRSYRHFARFLFQLAARYGRVQVPANRLTLNPAARWPGDGPNRPKSGLDLLEYIEVWNEPDKWWAGPEAFFAPEEYAAMLSACYDGHEGLLGSGFGIKTADASMQVVMGGLSNFNLDYLKKMQVWFEKNRRDRRFAADVVNFHHYSNKNQALQPNFEYGISPEEDRLKEKLKTLVQHTRKTLPGKQFWFSEFGYDTRQNSPQRAAPYGRHDAETVQAMWVARSYMEGIAAGADACFAYNLIDENSEEAGLFQSCGLAHSEKAGFGKKPSWKAVAELAENLNGASLLADQSVGQLRVYKFKNKKGVFTLSWSLNDTVSGFPKRS